MSIPSDQRLTVAIQEAAIAWWVRLDGGDLNHRQRSAFSAWVNSNPAHRSAFDEICRLWGELDGIKPF